MTRSLLAMSAVLLLPACADQPADAVHGAYAVEVRHSRAHDTSAPLTKLANVPRELSTAERTTGLGEFVVAEGTNARGKRVAAEGTNVARKSAAAERMPALALAPDDDDEQSQGTAPPPPPVMSVPRGSAAVEQRSHGTRPAARLIASFDGLGVGFVGPQGSATLRNPSDNSVAVGRDYIMQVVNTRMAIFTKKGAIFDTTGRVLYGPVETRHVFAGFGGVCEARNNGDAVVRYDQLADRWLVVMPIFSRTPVRPGQPDAAKGGDPAQRSLKGNARQPGGAAALTLPPPPPPPAAGDTARPTPRPAPTQDTGP
ncbi:MAG: hypothetical protein U0132_20970, partial [Gemmatimonadaceae bacterium]